MSESFNSNNRIYLAENVVPRLIFTDGKSYLDFNSIRQLCGGDNIAKTTLFCLIKDLPNVDENMIRYRNRSYFEETFVLIQLKHLIFN
jgi:hypothetical protein